MFSFFSMGSFDVRGSGGCPEGDRERLTGQGRWRGGNMPPMPLHDRPCRSTATAAPHAPQPLHSHAIAAQPLRHNAQESSDRAAIKAVFRDSCFVIRENLTGRVAGVDGEGTLAPDNIFFRTMANNRELRRTMVNWKTVTCRRARRSVDGFWWCDSCPPTANRTAMCKGRDS